MRLNSRIRQGTSERLRGIFEYLDGDIQTEEDFDNSRIRSLEVTSRDIQDYFSVLMRQLSLKCIISKFEGFILLRMFW